MFSVVLERKLHPEQEKSEESDVCRSRLQLFHLAGGASRTDLRGVNPLVKALDQIQSAETADDNLLLFLLKEALTGNNRTFLIYYINPAAGLLDDETPAALDLAQKTSRLVTKSTAGRWSPKAAEREIREQIFDLQNTILSRGEGEVSNTYKLAELTQILQAVKNQSWEKRKEESERIKAQIKCCNSSNQLLSKGHPTDHAEITQTVRLLQDKLRQEMEEHIKDGKGSMEEIQERVTRMKQLKETLREETLRKETAGAKTHLSAQSQLEYNEAQQRRRQLKEDHGRLIQEEVEKMERDLAQERLPQQESPKRELQVLSRERQVLVLQIEALRAEAQQAERDLEDQHGRHQTELQCLKEESLQVFRVFRQVCEEQRKLSESRYRGVLLEAVQDAVYLSAQNQQLQADNQHLRKALGEIKDALAVRGDPVIHETSQQQ
ncbi:trichohyalin isoform X1 [Oryzias melastigma]|uniref:trichohyalin isoform X1 n=1 Tax=Oryzias melastigma TaxID=30732 RepID=UPI000CF7CA19|nr:trichohyalin isoform X1 [Oryzias melastigma]